MPFNVETLSVVSKLPGDRAIAGGDAYDAARRDERTMAMWRPSLQSADREIVPAKSLLDARTRDTMRNDAYVQGGATIHQDNIVGALYALNAKPAAKLLGKGFDADWESEFQEEAEERFTLYAESPDNWLDASRMNTFTEMVRLAVGVWVATGEVLGTAEWFTDFGRPYSTAIQLIDTDRLSTPFEHQHNSRIVAGVEKDGSGAPKNYHIRMAHASDYHRSPENVTWRAVPVRKPWGRLQVLHVVEQRRVDQSRGVAAMTSALKEMRMTKNFRDVVLQNAVVNATYVASIESDLPSADVFATMGGGESVTTGMNQYLEGYLSQLADYTTGAKNLTMDGVKIPHLFPGTKLQMHTAGQGGPLGQQFEQSLLRYIAASLGVSYEQLSRDYTQTNYSSARAAMAETWKRMGSVKRSVTDRIATAIYRLWLEEAVNKGLITSLPRAARREGWLYSGQRLDMLSRCEWIGASRGQIDELKETQAAVLRLKYNLTTEEYEIARLGMDWRNVKRQRAREKSMDTELGLVSPEADPNMMNASTGEPPTKDAES